MNRRATLTRPAQSQDADGTPTLSFVTIKTSVPCAADQMSGAEAKRYGRETSAKLYSAIFLPSAGVNEKDRVVISGLGTLEVLNTNSVPGPDGETEYMTAALEVTE